MGEAAVGDALRPCPSTSVDPLLEPARMSTFLGNAMDRIKDSVSSSIEDLLYFGGRFSLTKQGQAVGGEAGSATASQVVRPNNENMFVSTVPKRKTFGTSRSPNVLTS